MRGGARDPVTTGGEDVPKVVVVKVVQEEEEVVGSSSGNNSNTEDCDDHVRPAADARGTFLLRDSQILSQWQGPLLKSSCLMSV